MAITFHCEHCGKEIRAADSAGGKWGKCPACHNNLYVPNLNIDGDIALAPIDERDEERERSLMAETYRLTQDILQERGVPEEPEEANESARAVNEQELTKYVIMYLRQMADGELDEADATAKSIKPSGHQAIEILDRIALSEIPEPELADVAPQVLAGLIRALRSRIT